MTTDGVDRAEEERQAFAAFVAQHARGLDRLAYLMLGDGHAAEDLAADVLLAAWQHWDRVMQADHPLAYVRQILVNKASGHFRRRARELTALSHLRLLTSHHTNDPDGAAVVDVRAALLRLPPRRRACLVLRHCFDLTECEVAETLGISVGTVKSQTSKAVAQFRREIGEAASAVAASLEAEKQAANRQRRASHAG
ncbi:MAG TPA: SigE family RNA polymerase sigma factor [Kineosporiaceae bacterium]|nr:SigE family RNA polymerase sigma factor [Kineosporiaceae bacterium]